MVITAGPEPWSIKFQICNYGYGYGELYPTVVVVVIVVVGV